MWGRVAGSGCSCYRAMGHREDKEPLGLIARQSLSHVPRRGTCAERISGKLPERPKCSTKYTLTEPDTRLGGIVARVWGGRGEQRGEAQLPAWQVTEAFAPVATLPHLPCGFPT